VSLKTLTSSNTSNTEIVFKLTSKWDMFKKTVTLVSIFIEDH